MVCHMDRVAVADADAGVSTEPTQKALLVDKDKVLASVLAALAPLLHQLPGDRFETVGRFRVEDIVADAVSHQRPITFVMPAFPFKSPNVREKTLGVLPDRGEAVALARLDALCAAIASVYVHGARAVIFSDGRIFNDIIGVSLDTMDAYAMALEDLARDSGLTHLVFDRLEAYTTTEEPNTELLVRYGCDQLDMAALLKEDSELLATYRSFRRFLAKDLALTWAGLSKSAIDKAAGVAAKCMIQRNMAFSSLVDDCYPHAIRLSIHAYDNAGPKYSVALIPQLESAIPTTPWHCVMCQDRDGSLRSRKHEDVDTSRYTLETKYGRPWQYVEKA
ncbi:hypothetical protein SPRG_10779 [Saprolegnia parasitica CBS 223.65]|uniref:Pyoverdine/dityrosine biosynthesis protein n=1 Tax=Saprolegnia parasitica (strain CBS 223.65) TaxID=695850 RepID=A0A067BYI4_SAPPC|nr:hypothetical protein SPRG_10779 [Saprolegnia parasitica CBS 223.65]KDO23584.1 hypothetical protein SPRG_10779 [Saprolegnia parasitica CBS 223.65]|eukprot:XP_012205732.1 hypothetical protein SPRG_10779 [Saprolegnia parasitica CBS 223.65]